MNDHELMDALRATRRASDTEIASGVDRHALGALREGITMTDRNQISKVDAPRRGRRLGGRGMAAGALGIMLIGGGAAYAAYTNWYVGGAADGLTCMTTWQDPLDNDGPQDSTGGPELTGDPVSDCQRYQQLSGKPQIADAAAFTRFGGLYVAPRGQVPADGQLLVPDPAERSATIRLEAALEDWVDGGNSKCFNAAEAVPYMQSEIKLLALDGWTTKVMPDNRPYEDGPCGFFDTDPVTRTAMFFPNRQVDPDLRKPDNDAAGFVYDVRDALRAGITDKCVSTTEAEATVAKALGTQHHWPTTVVLDDQAKCSSVDLQVGGSTQIWIYGPKAVKP
jgi:hypothetical protein